MDEELGLRQTTGHIRRERRGAVGRRHGDFGRDAREGGEGSTIIPRVYQYPAQSYMWGFLSASWVERGRGSEHGSAGCLPPEHQLLPVMEEVVKARTEGSARWGACQRWGHVE